MIFSRVRSITFNFMWLRYQARINWISVIWLLSPGSRPHPQEKRSWCLQFSYRFHISQELITWSEQLPCTRVTAFPRISLFLERFWHEFRIPSPTNQSAKHIDLKMIIFAFWRRYLFLVDILYFECVRRRGGDSIFVGKSALKCV